jgi:hypothetical protein
MGNAVATKYIYTLSTTMSVPSSKSGLPHPSPPGTTRGGGSNSYDWRKSLVVCSLYGHSCAMTDFFVNIDTGLATPPTPLMSVTKTFWYLGLPYTNLFSLKLLDFS